MEKDLDGGRTWLVGDKFTMADILAIVLISRVYFCLGESMFGPNVSAYWKRWQERPSFKSAPVVYKIDQMDLYEGYEPFKYKFFGVIGFCAAAGIGYFIKNYKK